MAARLNPRQCREPVTVETLTGAGGWGDQYDAARRTRAALDTTRKLVRDQGGSEVVSETTLLLHPQLTPQAEALFTPGSRTTVRGHTGTVLTCKPVVSHGRVVYVEVTLS